MRAIEQGIITDTTKERLQELEKSRQELQEKLIFERMVKEAEANAASDKAKKEEADLRNECEQIIFAAKKSVDDLGTEVTDEEKTNIENATKELQEALSKDNLEDIKAKKEALEKAAQSVAMKAYQKAQEQASKSQDGNNNQNSDGTVDATYEETDK